MPVVISTIRCTSLRLSSWKSRMKLLPRCDHCTSTSQRSLMMCWSPAFHNGDGPTSQPYVPYLLGTAIWRCVVSMGRVSAALRAFLLLAAQVFWNENLLPWAICHCSFQL